MHVCEPTRNHSRISPLRRPQMHTRSTVSHRATRRLDVSLSSSTTTEPRGLSITLPRHTLPLHPCPRKRARVRYEAGREERPRHGHRSLRRRYDQLRRQEAASRPPCAAGRGPRRRAARCRSRPHADPGSRGLGTVTCFVPQGTESQQAPAPSPPPTVPVPVPSLEEEAAAAAARRIAERKARKLSERRTYLVAAVMSSLGFTSMAVAAVYYRFHWQLEVHLLFASTSIIVCGEVIAVIFAGQDVPVI